MLFIKIVLLIFLNESYSYVTDTGFRDSFLSKEFPEIADTKLGIVVSGIAQFPILITHFIILIGKVNEIGILTHIIVVTFDNRPKNFNCNDVITCL